MTILKFPKLLRVNSQILNFVGITNPYLFIQSKINALKFSILNNMDAILIHTLEQFEQSTSIA